MWGLTAAACSVPEFDFAGPPPLGNGGDGNVVRVPHCINGELDSESGESDFDCGRGCSPCGPGKHCGDVADCEAGLLCHEGTCLEAGCMNDVQDGAETDVDCGGGACRTCVVDQRCGRDRDCETGVCGDARCLEPACNDRVINGKETGLDCGGSCAPCPADEPCLADKDCASGECNEQVCGVECKDGFANCDRANDNACEIDVGTDPENCGSCGKVCELPQAEAECSQGECRIKAGSCEPGYRDCNGDAADGCEVELATNELHCGACHQVCPDLNGSPSCAAGKCAITCQDGFANCDNSTTNGCEVNLATSSKNCNACGKVCAAAAGYSAYCKDGSCGQTLCSAGKGDCNGDPLDACETTLTSDVNNCGGCGIKCEAVNASVSCVSGKCVISACGAGYADCSGGYADGCETNTQVNANHCGVCGTACATSNASATTCNAGKCDPTCSPGWGKCATPERGCVTPLGTTAHCSQCGEACVGATPFCDPGGCVDHRDIVVLSPGVRAVQGWSGGSNVLAEIKLSHTLQTAKSGGANHRMLLVGVAATDNYTAPENIAVTYAGVAMTPVVERMDINKHSYAGIYYMLDAALPEAGAGRQLLVSFGGPFTWGHGGVELLELKNVMQVAPIASGSSAGDNNCSAGIRRSATVTFNQPGSLVYGFLAARGASKVTLVDPTQSVVQTFNQVQTSPDRLGVAAAYLFSNQTHSMAWDVLDCQNSAAAIVAIKRLSAN